MIKRTKTRKKLKIQDNFFEILETHDMNTFINVTDTMTGLLQTGIDSEGYETNY